MQHITNQLFTRRNVNVSSSTSNADTVNPVNRNAGKWAALVILCMATVGCASGPEHHTAQTSMGETMCKCPVSKLFWACD